jgi:hypothetical protein
LISNFHRAMNTNILVLGFYTVCRLTKLNNKPCKTPKPKYQIRSAVHGQKAKLTGAVSELVVAKMTKERNSQYYIIIIIIIINLFNFSLIYNL